MTPKCQTWTEVSLYQRFLNSLSKDGRPVFGLVENSLQRKYSHGARNLGEIPPNFWISYLSSNELRNSSALQYQRKILRLPQTTPILLFGLRCCVFCQKDSKTKTKERNTSIKCTLNQYLSWYSSVAGRKALPSSVIFARSLWKIAWSNYCPFSRQIFACGKFRIGSVTYFLG